MDPKNAVSSLSLPITSHPDPCEEPRPARLLLALPLAGAVSGAHTPGALSRPLVQRHVPRCRTPSVQCWRSNVATTVSAPAPSSTA